MQNNSVSLWARYDREQERLLRATLPTSGFYSFALPDVFDVVKPEDLTGPARRAALRKER